MSFFSSCFEYLKVALGYGAKYVKEHPEVIEKAVEEGKKIINKED